MMDQILCMAPSAGGDHTDVDARYNDAGSPGLQRAAGDSEQTSRNGAEDGIIAAAFNSLSFGGACPAGQAGIMDRS